MPGAENDFESEIFLLDHRVQTNEKSLAIEKKAVIHDRWDKSLMHGYLDKAMGRTILI